MPSKGKVQVCGSRLLLYIFGWEKRIYNTGGNEKKKTKIGKKQKEESPKHGGQSPFY